MDYPTLMQVYGSDQKDDSGTKTSRTVSGKLKIRSYFTADVKQFSIKHDVDDDGKDELKDFYIANRKAIFNFTWAADQQVYTCRFLRAMKCTPQPGAMWAVISYMEVV